MTVQALMLKLALRVDPYDVNNAEFTTSTVGVNDGEAFTKQRILDIYNEARLTIATYLRILIPSVHQRLEAVSWAILPDVALSFTAAKASVPAGFIEPASPIRRNNGVDIPIVSVSKRRILEDEASTTNPFVWIARESGTLVFIAKDNTVVPDTSGSVTYALDYHGITDWTLSNVTGGTSVETLHDTYLPLLLDVAEMIANEQGSEAIEGIVVTFLRRINAT